MLLTIILIIGKNYIIQAFNNIELDHNSYISMPSSIYNGKGTIYISSLVESGYNLYYQKIDLSNTVYNQIISKEEEYQAYSNIEQTKLTEEKVNVNSLQEEYQTLSKNENATQTQIEEAYQAYVDALNAYNSHVETYNTEIEKIENELYGLIPIYQENNWIQASGTSDNVNLDFSNYSGQINFVLWAKLITKNGTYYDMNCYSSNITSDTSISLDKTSISIEEGKTLKLIATTNSEKTITWTSSKENIATVDGEGNVKAIVEGTTVITATVDGKSATCTVTVTKAGNINEENIEWTDFSEAKISIEQSSDVRRYRFTISNVIPNSKHTYYYFIGDSNATPTFSTSLEQLTYDENKKVLYSNYIEKYLELGSDQYVYVYEHYLNENYELVEKIVLDKVKLEKPEQKKYTDAFYATIISNNGTNCMTQILFNTPWSDSTVRKVHIKIGKISDDTILKNIYNKNSNAFEELLKYAKETTGFYDKTLDSNSTGAAGGIKLTGNGLFDESNIQNEDYYFLYAVVEDENGKYVKTEGVTFARASKSVYNPDIFQLAFYGSEDFSWKTFISENTQNNTTKDDTVAPDAKLPQTGMSYVVSVLIAGIVICSTITYIRYKKYRDIK